AEDPPRALITIAGLPKPQHRNIVKDARESLRWKRAGAVHQCSRTTSDAKHCELGPHTDWQGQLRARLVLTMAHGGLSTALLEPRSRLIPL
ncbi:unnamed protein product, partial [Trichogramma brassicae]